MKLWFTKKETPKQTAEAVDAFFAAFMGNTTGYDPNGNYLEILSNPVAKYCIDLIATNTASISIYVTDNGEEVGENDPLLRLLRRPNSYTSGNNFIQELIYNYLLFGNGYFITPHNQYEFQRGFGTLKQVNPINVSVNAGPSTNFPMGWYVGVDRDSQTYVHVDQDTGQSNLFQFKNYNPDPNTYFGLAPAAAAYGAVRAYNQGINWNESTLQKGGKIASVWSPTEKAIESGITPDQWRKQQEAIRNFDKSNNGTVFLSGIQMDIKELAHSPKDLQLIESQVQNARQIAQAFNVPTQIVGIPGESTYSNYSEARLAFYEMTILPLIIKLCSDLTLWFEQIFPNNNYQIVPDLDSIEALREKRIALLNAVKDVSILTINERRELVQWDPINNTESNTLTGDSNEQI